MKLRNYIENAYVIECRRCSARNLYYNDDGATPPEKVEAWFYSTGWRFVEERGVVLCPACANMTLRIKEGEEK